MSVKTGLTSRCYHAVNGQDSIELNPGVEQFLPPSSPAARPELSLVTHCLQSARTSSLPETENQSRHEYDVVITQFGHLAPGSLADRDISGGEACGETYDMFVCSLSSHMVSALRSMIQL